MTTVLDTAPPASLAVPYSQIPKKPVHWFWKGFIPFRHVTLVIGPGGTSKGITTIDLGARMTRHDPAPGETSFDLIYDGRRDVIIIAPEDDPNETVAGRLEAAGAVMDRVHNLTVFPDGQRFSVPTDIAAITQAITEIEDPVKTTLPADGMPRKVGMVIMDPLLALAENEMTRRGQARPVMEALEDQAKANDIVILLTHHTNADGKAAGSRGIVETVRNQLTLSRLPKAPEDSPVRLLTVTKTNIGITGAVQRYALNGPVEAPQVLWTCEAPPADVSRGYDIAAGQHDSGPISGPPPGPPGGGGARASCVHPWKAGSCSDCPLRPAGKGGKHAAPKGAPTVPMPKLPYAGIPLDARYRASYMVSTASGDHKPKVIGDFGSAQLAREACEQTAGSELVFSPTQTPGLEGAKVINSAAGSTVYYGVLDRYAQAAKAAA